MFLWPYVFLAGTTTTTTTPSGQSIVLQYLSCFNFPLVTFQLFFNFALTLCPSNRPHYRTFPPDGVDPAVPLVLAAGAQLVRLVFALHHPAFVLRLAGLDLFSVWVKQLQAKLI